MTAFEEIAHLNVSYIPHLIDDYLEIAAGAGEQTRAGQKLYEWYEQYQGISLVLILTDRISREQGPQQGAAFLVRALHKRPSVRGLDRLIAFRAEGHLPAETSDDILRTVTSALLARQPGYRCSHCGFSGQVHHWQCPSCRNWDTTRTIQDVLGE